MRTESLTARPFVSAGTKIMSLQKAGKRFLRQTSFGRVVLMPFRLGRAFGYYTPKLERILRWTLLSKEVTNFTYRLTPANQEYLAHAVSVVTGVPYSVAIAYLSEIEEDEKIRRHIADAVRRSPERYVSDDICAYGRRIGWYAFVRILKPRVVVETGVDKGHGAVLLCAALMRNAAEGFPGRYFGTDINLQAGFLLSEPYDSVGTILYGDSVRSLESIPQIDLFINDSDHSEQYERREYETIAPKLGPDGIILGDNAHCNNVLARFSVERHRNFIFFQEQPRDHWYPGAGIGISFVRQTLPKRLAQEVSIEA